MQSKLVAADEVTGRAFVDAFEQVPVVLMSEGGVTDDVMRAVRLGAVDFLDKPLSVLKLKNIWQHSVRKLMQRTSLYDTAAAPHSFVGPTFSEPAGGLTSQPSLSGCLPSSMTAPIGVQPLHRVTSVGDANVMESNPKGGCVHRCSIDSPGTPSAGDAELAETVSAGSVHQLMEGTCHGNGIMGGTTTATATVDASGVASASCQDCWEKESRSSLQLEKPDSAGHPGAHPAASAGFNSNPFSTISTRKPAASLPRQKASMEQSWLFGQFGQSGKPVGPMVFSSSNAASRWPALPSGCVWGTPVGGPLLPPPFTSPTHPTNASLSITGGAPVAPPATSTTSTPTSPPLCMLQGGLRTHAPGNNGGAAPVLIKTRHSAPMELPTWRPSQTPAEFQSTKDLTSVVLPEGFLSLDKVKEDIKKGPRGPIGLKLRKSNSLVDLINEALAAPAGN